MYIQPAAVPAVGVCREQQQLENAMVITPFVETMARADMCAFVSGYFKFIAETEVTVLSILTFMPGMKVVVATHPGDFYVYQK